MWILCIHEESRTHFLQHTSRYKDIPSELGHFYQLRLTVRSVNDFYFRALSRDHNTVIQITKRQLSKACKLSRKHLRTYTCISLVKWPSSTQVSLSALEHSAFVREDGTNIHFTGIFNKKTMVSGLYIKTGNHNLVIRLISFTFFAKKPLQTL